MAALSQRRARRALLCVATGIAWSAVTLLTGFVTSLLALLAVLVVDGVTTGSVSALHTPLLVDSYPPPARVRLLSAYAAFGSAGDIASPLLVAVFAGVFGLTWRGVFLALGIVSTLGAVAASGLRDPGFGRHDTERVRASVRGTGGADHDVGDRPPAGDLHADD